MASNVAEFDSLPPPPQPHQSFPPHPMHVMQSYGSSYPPPPAPVQPHVKAEPVDNRYVLNGPTYTLPPLPGPQLGARPGVAHQAVLSFPQGPMPIQPQQNNVTRSFTARIPQVDGPSNSDDDDESPSPGGYAPRSSHPSLPQPQSQTSTTKDEEAINSDLDDSDSENEEDAEDGSAAESDIVFCTYDKVITAFHPPATHPHPSFRWHVSRTSGSAF